MKIAMPMPSMWHLTRCAAALAVAVAAALGSPPAAAELSVYTFCDPGGGAATYGTGLVTSSSGPLERTIADAYAYANDVRTLTVAPLTLKGYSSAGGADFAYCDADSRVQQTVLFKADASVPVGATVRISWGFLFDGSVSAWATEGKTSTGGFRGGRGDGAVTAYLKDGSTSIARFDAYARAESYDSNFGVLSELRYDLGYYDLLDWNNYKEASSRDSASFDTRTAFGVAGNGLTLELVNGREYTVDYDLDTRATGTIGAGSTVDFANRLIGTFAAAPDCTNCSGLQIYIGGVPYELSSAAAPEPPTVGLFAAAMAMLLMLKRQRRTDAELPRSLGKVPA